MYKPYAFTLTHLKQIITSIFVVYSIRIHHSGFEIHAESFKPKVMEAAIKSLTPSYVQVIVKRLTLLKFLKLLFKGKLSEWREIC